MKHNNLSMQVEFIGFGRGQLLWGDNGMIKIIVKIFDDTLYNDEEENVADIRYLQTRSFTF